MSGVWGGGGSIPVPVHLERSEERDEEWHGSASLGMEEEGAGNPVPVRWKKDEAAGRRVPGQEEKPTSQCQRGERGTKEAA